MFSSVALNNPFMWFMFTCVKQLNVCYILAHITNEMFISGLTNSQ